MDQFKESHIITALTLGSYRLLPLLFHNLHTQGIEDPFLKRFKGVYRNTWYKNQILFHAVTPLLNCFHDADIKTLILKGADK